MSVTGNIIGMPAGSGGSFPMAGTRPKVRKTLTVVSSSITWTAPNNVYHVILQMVGGGGSGGISRIGYSASFFNTTAYIHGDSTPNCGGGQGGTAVPPTIIPVNPGSTYVLTGGVGGRAISSSLTDTFVTGMSGSNSSFTGDVLNIVAPGGEGGRTGSYTNTNTAFINAFPVMQPQSVLQSSGILSIPGASSPTASLLIVSVSAGNVTLFSDSSVVTRNQASLLKLPTGWAPRDQLDRSVETTLGGNTTPVLVWYSSNNGPNGYHHVFGGGASLYGTGSNGITTGSITASVPGFGGGGGCGLSQTANFYNNYFLTNGLILNATNFPLIGTSSAGGHGFVRIIWEE